MNLSYCFLSIAHDCTFPINMKSFLDVCHNELKKSCHKTSSSLHTRGEKGCTSEVRIGDQVNSIKKGEYSKKIDQLRTLRQNNRS